MTFLGQHWFWPIAHKSTFLLGGGSLKGLVDDLKMLTGKGEAIEMTWPEGRLTFGVFAAFSESERELIRERTRTGLAAASASAALSYSTLTSWI